MLRLFVAIRPPIAIRERLLAAMGGVASDRWQSDEQLHLTLRFIGEAGPHAARAADAALAAVHHPPFEIALAGIGAFDRRGEPVALWAGVAPHAPLKILHNKIDQAIVRAGLPPERRAFAPHIPLARLPRGAGPVKALLETSGGLASPPFTVDEFSLLESGRPPDGPVYPRLERYSLA